MGRSSKLFSLSGRKASPGLQASANNSRENQAHLSKAERLLGTTGLQEPSRHQIPRRPSYISLVPSISEAGEEHDDFSSPDHYGQDPLPLRLADLQHNRVEDHAPYRASSNASYSHSCTSQHSRRMGGSWSSTTLRTRYDPLSMSSNRSDHYDQSAERVAISKRGAPQVVEPDYRRPSTASVDSSDLAKVDSHDRATALPDISRLHPRMVYHQHGVHINSNPAGASSNVSASPRFPGAAPPSRPYTSAGSLKRASGGASKTLRGHLSVESFSNSIKLFSRRSRTPSVASVHAQPAPQSRTPSRNWWDGFPVEESNSDSDGEHDPNLVTPTEARFPPTSNQASNFGPSDPGHHGHSGPGNSPVPPRVASTQEIISARSSVTVRTSQHPLNRGSRPSSRITLNDLHETSVLSTSSSDSEPDSDVDEVEEHRRDIRDSIALSEIDVHHVGQAQALPMKAMRRVPHSVGSDRRPSLASISSVPTTADSSSIKSGGHGPAYLSVPNRSNRSRKSGHTRQPSSIPEDSDHSSQVASPTSPPSSMRSFGATPLDNRRLMAVTEEEEALLEMMRRKRADKAAQRDSGMASVISTTTQSTRPFSNLSGSSSILDSFPISRSQRSSLLASRAAQSPQSAQDSPSVPRDTERGRNRQSVATMATDNTYYSIDSRLESPTRLKYAFTPHLSLASLDVSLTGLQSPHQDDVLPSPGPLDSPATPLTRRGSTEVLICDTGSKHDSIVTHTYGEKAHSGEEVLREKLEERQRRKTTSNATPRMMPRSEDLELRDKACEPASYVTRSNEDGSPSGSPNLGAEESGSSGSSNRASTISKNTSDCGSACGHSACSGNRLSTTGYGLASGTRCSVSEDVLAAWGSLGGWRDAPGIMG